MRHHHAKLIRCVAAMLLLACFSVTASAQIPWIENVSTKEDLSFIGEQSHQQDKMVLLHFYSDKDKNCISLERGAFQDPLVQDVVASNFVPVKVDVYRVDPKLLDVFSVTKMPTTVIVNTKSQVVSHAASPQMPRQFIEMLATAARTDGRKLQSGQQVAAANPAANAPGTNPYANNAVANAAAPGAGYAQPPVTQPAVAAPAMDAQRGGYQQPVSSNAAPVGGNGYMAVMPPGMQPQTGTPAIPAGYQQPGSGADAYAIDPTNSVSPGTSAAVSSPNTPPKSHANLEIALDGYCPVSIKGRQWVEGKLEHGVVHLGQLYLFADAAAKQKFLANPLVFTPILCGHDVVSYLEGGKLVRGSREFGIIDGFM
ncbi:MAG: thioredoxin family protein, partial [Planctomycetota bacterium]